MNNSAQTPLKNPVSCKLCRASGNMLEMAVYNGGSSTTFLHKECEEILIKAGNIYKTWMGYNVFTRLYEIDDLNGKPYSVIEHQK